MGQYNFIKSKPDNFYQLQATLLAEIRIYHIRGIATLKGINYLEQKINEE